MKKTYSLIEQLQQLLGKDRVISDPDELIVFECDALTLHKNIPEVVVLPESTEEVSAITKLCSEHKTPFLARASGTGLSGGATPAKGGVIIQLSRMNQILKLDYEDEIAVVQPGVINLHLTEAVSSRNYHFAPDPSSEKACTIGGNVAENAGGPHTLKYGVTTNHVLGMKTVMPTGEIVELGGHCEDSPGYDLTGLFTGSEGTFGIITEVTVKLTRNPESIKTLLAVFNSTEDASISVSNIIAEGIIPAAMELIDQLAISAVEQHLNVGYPTDAAAVLLIEIDGIATSLDEEAERIRQICLSNGAMIAQIARTDKEREDLWRGRKETVGTLGKITPAYYTNDGVVPRSKLPKILTEAFHIGNKYGLRVANICHAGDGNIHPLILYNPDDKNEVENAIKVSKEIIKKCIELGGSITGEHGVGTEKSEYLGMMFSKEDQEQMKKIRDVFNSDHLLNPGKIFPTQSKRNKINPKRTKKLKGWL